ncbi:MAG TPA: polysaccharide deacetylase family protein [Polyangia bacterium]|jgi:peptidoglycan/xylan/chitin deacetylase (PgdA/CDA1 family)|nr:polysaccharide deacetylase family protein [Polyangia bacterium]
MDFDPRRRLVLCAALSLLASTGCASTCGCGARVDNGGRGATGVVASSPPTRSDATNAPRPLLTVGLPTPPGAANVPRPSGAAGNLKVLDWAGFKSAVSYTFDDGQPSQIEHYAELQATGVRLTFFVNSASATWEAGFVSTFSQAARDGHEIGNHTVHHCHADPDGTLYTGTSAARAACAGDSAAAELDDCTAFITSKLGARVWTAAWPFGDAGYAPAATTRFFLSRGAGPGTVAPNDDTDPSNLPIWGPAENDTVEKFVAEIDRAHASDRWVIMLLHSLAPTTAPWYATVDIAAVTGSIAHAKSLGDVWIDSLVNVGAYWRGQKIVAAARPVVSGTTQTQTQTWSWTLPDHFPAGRHLRVRVDGGTLAQGGKALSWDGHGYYEIALDAAALTLSP